MSKTLAALPEGYEQFLGELKEQIRTAQIKAALAVNRELVLLYWQIGHAILIRQKEQGWGAKVVERLSADLKRAFPEMKGFSARNLKYMRAFAEAWHEESFVQQLAAQIPWFHHCVLLDKVKIPRNVNGIFKQQWSMVGVAMFWECRLKAGCISGKEKQSAILSVPFHLYNLI